MQIINMGPCHLLCQAASKTYSGFTKKQNVYEVKCYSL
jgi:hypothetical protein